MKNSLLFVTCYMRAYGQLWKDYYTYCQSSYCAKSWVSHMHLSLNLVVTIAGLRKVVRDHLWETDLSISLHH